MLPSTQSDTRTLEVTQQGQFSYAGAAEPGTTYPSGVIETGDTVWTKLARQVTFSFTHTLMGPDLTEVHGTMRLDVSVTAADGWTAVVTQGPVAALDDGTGTASVTVEPAAAAALLSRHYAEIGGVGGGSSLTVTPVVEMTGLAEGRGFTAGSPAGLPFTLDAASLRPAGGRNGPGADREDRRGDRGVVPRTIPVLDFRCRSTSPGSSRPASSPSRCWCSARAPGSAGPPGDAADQFLVRHADRILPVAAFNPGPTVFDVADAESLHRVAERFDTVVLHHATEDEDVFVVRDADATYRFVVPGAEGRHRGKPPVPAPVHAPEPVDSTRPLPRSTRCGWTRPIPCN